VAVRDPVLPIGSDPVLGEIEHLGELSGDGIEPRRVILWLPPSYRSDPELRYPVLYMHDGHNAVDPATSYSGVDWAVDEVAVQLIDAARIREFILAGVYCTDDRFQEYGYTPSGRAYLQFLVDTLKPIVDGRFRTMPGREDTFVMGSSMGGLASFLALWWHPEVFSGAACLSPFFPDELVADVEESAGWPPAPVRIYLDNGGDELDSSFQPNIDALLEVVGSLGSLQADDVVFFGDPIAPHHEVAWSHRVWRPLEFLLGR
jgi:predicted alpha/beta superfamily hydrolase